jgi:CRP-like cAMP-binding protein
LAAHACATVGLAVDAGSDGFWRELTPALRTDLESRGSVRRFVRGRALFYEGQVGDCVFVLRSGRAKVVTATPNGREVLLGFRDPGDLVGEVAVLDGGVRSATVRAVDDVVALALSAAAFLAFLERHWPASRVLMQSLGRRLREADAQRVEFSAFTAVQRVAARLVELGARYGEEEAGAVRIALPLSQDELAGATGQSVESVGRALHTMRSLGYLATARLEIRILQPAALEALRDMTA